MAKFVTEKEIARLRAAAPDSLQGRMYAALKERVLKNTQHPGLRQPDDVQEWYHISEKRCCDAAFLWHVERDEMLGQWLRDVAFWIRDQEDTEWIGPWFRPKNRPLVGQLETSHISVGLVTILDLCEELFTQEEKKSLEDALIEKGMIPCKRFCEKVLDGTGHNISNWFSVLTYGYGACALYFEDEDAIQQTLSYLPYCYKLYNKGCYGETLHYSNYASLVLAEINELFLRVRPDLKEKIDLSCYGDMMEWYAASFLHMKPWNEGEAPKPRFFSTGDSGATFMPSPSLLTHISAHLKDEMPEPAGIASWLMQTCMGLNIKGATPPDGNSTNASYHTILLITEIADPIDPADLHYPNIQYFENGEMFLRDDWKNPKARMAIQAGYAPLNVCAHRHEDHGSFQFVQGRERMIADGATTCYRLQAFRYTCSSNQHSVVDFLEAPQFTEFNHVVSPYEGVIGQKTAKGNHMNPVAPYVKNLINEEMGNAHVLLMDLTDAYEERISKARRAIITAMPHAVFIIDQAETTEPLRMRTHFPMNNRDNKLKTHRADEHRYVFRRNGEAMKIFECEAYLDGEKTPSKMEFGWGYCHECQTTYGNFPSQGKEGSMEIYNWVDQKPCKKHLRICAIASDKDEFIKGWHIKPDAEGNWYIESPQKEKWLTLKIENDHVYLIQNDKITEVM